MHAMDNAYALVIGIASYRHINQLPPAVLKDAQDIHDLLVDPQCCGYPPGNVRLLLDAQATQSAIRQALSDLAARSNQDATVFMYISSHGGQIESGTHAGEYLLPVDVDCVSDRSIAATALSNDEFTRALRAIPARKVVVVFDCCHAGGIGNPKDSAASQLKVGLSDRYYDTLTRGRGRAILASSRSDEWSMILLGARNSLFTQHLLDGLRGDAPGQGGAIRIFDLFDYVQPKVTAACPNQHPVFKAEIEENFAVALYRGGKSPAPAAPSSFTDDYEYDIFVSYQDEIFARYQGDTLLKCVPEHSWLCRLLRRLADAGLRVSGAFRAPLGYPEALYSEDAVQKSRYVLLALSQAYLEDTYAELEGLIAQRIGVEQSQYRIIPVLMEDCIPRLGLRILPLLDMSTESRFELNLERLIYQLRQPPIQRQRSQRPGSREGERAGQSPAVERRPSEERDLQGLAVSLQSVIPTKMPQFLESEGCLTVMFDDIKDSTPYVVRYGDYQWENLVRRHDDILRPVVQSHCGFVVKGLGDGSLCVFPSAVDGVRAAIEIQHAIHHHNSSAHGELDQLHVRIGLHTGTVLVGKTDVLGLVVSVASRVCGKADADEIVISEATYRQAGDAVGVFEPMGSHPLKGVEQPVFLYRYVETG